MLFGGCISYKTYGSKIILRTVCFSELVEFTRGHIVIHPDTATRVVWGGQQFHQKIQQCYVLRLVCKHSSERFVFSRAGRSTPPKEKLFSFCQRTG